MIAVANNQTTEALDPVVRLERAVRPLARELDRKAAGTLVEIYYRWQEHRIALSNQLRAQLEQDRPREVIDHFATQVSQLERQMVGVLGEWARSRPEGAWAQAQKGIGPVLSAGLGAHIDIHRAQTAGAIWRFAGLDPTLKWLGREGARKLLSHVVDDNPNDDWQQVEDELPDDYALSEQDVALLDERLTEDRRGQLSRDQLVLVARLTNRKLGNLIRLGSDEDGRITRASMLSLLAKRPWNADLKVLCWRAGDSFVKVSGRDDAFYGQVYRERKELEVERNKAGLFVDQAKESLATRNIKDKKLKATYEAGFLPAGRIDLRARRYAVKLFLAHYHEVAFRAEFGKEPPLPYPIAYLGHVHKIDPPPAA